MIIKETQLLKENIGIRENIKNKTLFILYKQGRLENKRYFRRCIILPVVSAVIMKRNNEE